MPDDPYFHKVHTLEATDSQRAAYLKVCEDLASEPVPDGPIARTDTAMLSCRATKVDRTVIAGLADDLGLTRNTMMLTALRLGLGAVKDARSEVGTERMS